MGLLLLLLRQQMTMMVLLLLGWWSHHCHSCLPAERAGVLEIRDSFNIGLSLLPTWYRKDADCCNWEGVFCNPTTGRVVGLYLPRLRDPNLGDWYLNASLFLPFQHLSSLRLYGNGIVGCLQTEGFEKLSTLGNLKLLDLGYNKFNNSILSSLTPLSSLESLYLYGNRLKGSINIQELNLLQNLKKLDLMWNEIEDFKSFTGGDEILKLSNLKWFYLSANRFHNTSFLSSLEGLSSLQVLDMARNQLKGSFDMRGLEALSNLQDLRLDGNEIIQLIFPKDIRGFGNLSLLSLCHITTSGRSVPFSLLQSLALLPNLRSVILEFNNFEGTLLAQALLPLKNLEELYLSHSTNLRDSFLKSIVRISSLKRLFLSKCGLNETILAAQGLCELKHLQRLVIDNNDLRGVLPWCLANLTSLQYLDLSSNHFRGDISTSPLKSLTSIQYLFLSDNHFQIPFSLSSFFNHSKLKYFNGSNNEIYSELDDHNLTPKFQLEGLYLSGSGQRGAYFPKFLFYQYKLRELDFANMKLMGGFPSWLLENNTLLNQLNFANNSLSGSFRLPIHPHLHLSELDISDNYFHGSIPREIGTYFPSLTILSMSGNNFTGTIPSSIGIMLSLRILYLSNNNISGTLQSSLKSPLHVYLSYNSLQGSLGHAIQNSFQLITLDLSHNLFTGSIPEWIGDMSYLSFLLLGHNYLEGRIPHQLCKLFKLRFIDLSHNNFNGCIPLCLKFRSTSSNTVFKSLVPREPIEITTKGISYSYSISISRYMSGMDLSCNNLIGEIPHEIGNLNHISLLNLSNNHLIGPIPETFSNLNDVESLDLSRNNLNGKIPPQIVELNSLSFFNVAHNNLSGKTPEMVSQFSTFGKSSYEDNPFLCGPPLPRNCTEEEAPPSLPRNSIDNQEESDFMDASVFYGCFIVTYIMVLLGIATVLYINSNWRRAWFYFIERTINNCYFFVVDNFLIYFGFSGWKPLV